MISLLGHLLIVLALLAALAGSLSGFAAGPLKRPYLETVARQYAWSVLALVGGSALLMEYALVTHDFSVRFVADVGSRATPLYYTIASLWGALEGSILFWAFLLSAYTCAFLFATRRQSIQGPVTGILLAIASFFLLVIAIPDNPFAPVSQPPQDGPGLNPLLQNHWMMGVHPVLLYLGYVGLSVPFAVAVASLIDHVPAPATLRLIRRWALIPWIFLSLGIVAGMWWSYAVLGWGGYWSWDPVENVSVMPWLVATAFLHSIQVQERRGMLKMWTLSLVIVAFLLSVLGTFLTRSGVLVSVHAFTQSNVGPYFLGFLGIVMVASLAVLFARGRDLAAPGTLDSSICRETAFLFNNLFLVAITFTILLGTMFPLIAQAAQGSSIQVGAPYFDHVAVPIGFALLFLMGVGPALPWGAARLEQLQYRLLGPVAAGSLTIVALLAVGVRGIGAVATFGMCVFVLAVTMERMLADAAARRRSTGEGRIRAAVQLVAANPRRYGGYLVHVGVLLVIVGIASSQSYSVRASASLHRGQSMTVDGYRVTFTGFRAHFAGTHMSFAAAARVSRAGQNLGTYLPSQNFYLAAQETVPTPAVREEPIGVVSGLLQGHNTLADLGQLLHGRNPFEDVYIVLQAYDHVRATAPNGDPRSTATLQVLIDPLVGLIWLGGAVVGLGGLVALAPARRRAGVRSEVREPVRVRPRAEEASA